MNKENFIEQIKSPDLLKQGDLDFLTQVVNEFPFFQTSRLLLLKALQNTGSITIENELEHTAIYVPDRKKMFSLLHPYIQIEATNVTTSDIEAEKNIIKNKDDNGEGMKKDILSEIIAKRLSEINKSKDSDDIEEIADLENHPGKDFEHIADVILRKAAGSKKIKSDMQQGPFQQASGQVSNLQGQSMEGDLSLLEIDDTEKFAQQDDTARNVPPCKGVDNEDAQRELLQFDNGVEELSTTHYDKSMELLFSHKLNILDLKLPEEIFTEEDVQEEVEKEDLIEKFIKNSPSIDRKIPLENVEEHKDFSADSIKETEEYLTDTLANIYIRQGNYTKAIIAYEKLCLKYPEKSTYFADQIKKIKELIKK